MYDTISPVCHDHCLAYLQEISDLQMVSPWLHPELHQT
jgi:hypothetical protein